MAGKTGVYVSMGILCLCMLSICSSLSLILSGNSLAVSILARMMATFGISLSDQAKTICPSLRSNPKDADALDYITGKKECPEVPITDSNASGSGIPPTSGATTTTSWSSGASGTRSGTRSGL